QQARVSGEGRSDRRLLGPERLQCQGRVEVPCRLHEGGRVRELRRGVREPRRLLRVAGRRQSARRAQQMRSGEAESGGQGRHGPVQLLRQVAIARETGRSDCAILLPGTKIQDKLTAALMKATPRARAPATRARSASSSSSRVTSWSPSSIRRRRWRDWPASDVERPSVVAGRALPRRRRSGVPPALQVVDGIQINPDVELVLYPALPPRRSFVAVFGLRSRIVL